MDTVEGVLVDNDIAENPEDTAHADDTDEVLLEGTVQDMAECIAAGESKNREEQ